MRIVIDARMLYWTGVGRYTKSLLDELEAVDSENTYVVLVRREDWKAWEPSKPNFKKVEASINPYTLREQWSLYLQLRALQADLVHFTAPNTPLLYRGRRVVNIHDLTLLDYDTSRGSGLMKWLRGLKRLPFRLVLVRDARGATAIITPTDFVHDQVTSRLGAPLKRVHTTYMSADADTAAPESLERFGELGRYVFYVGNAYPYKNVGSTIEALAKLDGELADVNFVLAGKRDTYTADLERQAKELGVGERVKFVGFVSEGEKTALYQQAAAYVNASLSEGFGLQGLEAMAQDTPVVAARASCLPEVYGEAAEYFDPHSPADQAAAIARVLSDEAVAGRLRRAGAERLKRFSWRQTAARTLAIYRQIATK